MIYASRAGPKRAKSRRRKTVTQKRRGPRDLSAADHKAQSDMAQLIRERDEALEREKATAEVLRVISSSPGELEPVSTILENAIRICEAKFGVLYRYDGNLFHPEALVGVPPALVEFHRRRGAFQAISGTPLYQLWQTRNVVHTADDAGGPSASARLGGARSHLAVPMFKDERWSGALLSIIRKSGPSPTGRSSWWKISPTKPSSPSRMSACSTSYANRCSSRPLLPTCSRSSAARPSICRRCSIRWSSRPPGLRGGYGDDHSRKRCRFTGMSQAMAFRPEYNELHGTASGPVGPRLGGRTACWKASRSCPRCSGRSRIHLCCTDSGRLPHLAGRAAAAGRSADWRYRLDAQGGAAIHRKQIELVFDLRRPSGDRDRERAAVRRGAGAYARTDRSAGAADRNLGGAGVISSSPGELEPVFQTMLENATRICEAEIRDPVAIDGDAFASPRW